MEAENKINQMIIPQGSVEWTAHPSVKAMVIKPETKRRLSGMTHAESPGKVSKSLLLLCILNSIMRPPLASTRPGE
jgi:hypothetical protein